MKFRRLEEIEANVLKNLNITPVENINEVLKEATHLKHSKPPKSRIHKLIKFDFLSCFA